ncbi:MAG: hypothetical protein HC888_01950 [Candidatus Competibacteraceae bacterium]|nr:hypothetical protein [Candidatus Competibacteraceae bacterium]
MHRGEYLVHVLNTLVNISNDNQQLALSVRSSMSYLAYVKEFQTIKMACGRRTGHTYALTRFVSRRFPNAAVIAPTDATQSLLRSELEAAGASRNMVYNVRKLEASAGMFHTDAVVVDIASILTPRNIEEIYDRWKLIAANSDRFNFIFIG